MGSINWIKDNGQPITTNDRQATVEHAESIGWIRENEAIDPSIDGDKGSGIPGTKEWHESAIRGMSTKTEVIEYCAEIDIEIDNRGNLTTSKKRAIDAIGVKDDNSTADS